MLVMILAVIYFVTWCERAQRRIPVQYAKRVVGRKVYGGQSSHLPLKLNQAGVIPPIFASSLLMFPVTVGQFIDAPIVQTVTGWLTPGSLVYSIVYVALIIFFCYFYTAIQFNPTDVADNMKRNGGYIPGIRPGPRVSQRAASAIRVCLRGERPLPGFSATCQGAAQTIPTPSERPGAIEVLSSAELRYSSSRRLRPLRVRASAGVKR